LTAAQWALATPPYLEKWVSNKLTCLAGKRVTREHRSSDVGLNNKKPAAECGGYRKLTKIGRLLLPSTLLVPVRFQPLAALVLRHLQPTFLFKIAHGIDK
jgi:hypothetical protein